MTSFAAARKVTFYGQHFYAQRQATAVASLPTSYATGVFEPLLPESGVRNRPHQPRVPLDHGHFSADFVLHVLQRKNPDWGHHLTYASARSRPPRRRHPYLSTGRVVDYWILLLSPACFVAPAADSAGETPRPVVDFGVSLLPYPSGVVCAGIYTPALAFWAVAAVPLALYLY